MDCEQNPKHITVISFLSNPNIYPSASQASSILSGICDADESHCFGILDFVLVMQCRGYAPNENYRCSEIASEAMHAWAITEEGYEPE